MVPKTICCVRIHWSGLFLVVLMYVCLCNNRCWLVLFSSISPYHQILHTNIYIIIIIIVVIMCFGRRKKSFIISKVLPLHRFLFDMFDSIPCIENGLFAAKPSIYNIYFSCFIMCHSNYAHCTHSIAFFLSLRISIATTIYFLLLHFCTTFSCFANCSDGNKKLFAFT